MTLRPQGTTEKVRSGTCLKADQRRFEFAVRAIGCLWVNFFFSSTLLLSTSATK